MSSNTIDRIRRSVWSCRWQVRFWIRDSCEEEKDPLERHGRSCQDDVSALATMSKSRQQSSVRKGRKILQSLS